nr:hypothetical protein [Tanacetum cinerariifolium]
MIKLVVEIECVGMNADEFDKEIRSSDGLQPKQADLSCVHALNEPHLCEIHVVPKNPFLEGGGSSLFTELEEWEGDGMADDNYEEAPIVSEFVGKGFVDNYPNFQEDENNVSFLGVVLGVEEEWMPVYDTDTEDVIEEEEGFVRKGRFGGEEDSIEDVVVVANDLCSSINQTTLGVNFEEDINIKSHKLMSLGKSIIIKVSQSSYKFLFGKKYQESYLKDAPMDDKLGFKTTKVRG